MMMHAGPVKISSMEEIAYKYDICRAGFRSHKANLFHDV